MENINVGIEELNQEEARQYIGGVVFVGILMVIGIIGNLHVIFVYALRIKPSNHRTFILVLGVADFITCVIGMPFIIVDLRNPLTFTMVSACKLLRFINYFICTFSGLTLLIIAIDRYRKICVPVGSQISGRLTKYLCVIVFFTALLFTWPAPVMYGHSTVSTRVPNITGVRCYTDDALLDTKYQAYFNAFLILIVIVVFVILVVLYSLIGAAISKHSSFKSKYKPSPPSKTTSDAGPSKSDMTSFSDSETDEGTGKSAHVKTYTKDIIPMIEEVSESELSSGDTRQIKTTGMKKTDTETENAKQFNKIKRTTWMFFLITAAFFMSYFPHLILKTVSFLNKGFVADMNFTGKVFYNTFVWCFFINNTANSFIYGFCDIRFRTEVKKMYSQMYNQILTCRT